VAAGVGLQSVIDLFTSNIDFTLYRAINGLSGPAVPNDVFRFIAIDFEYVFIALVALAFLLPWRWHLPQRRVGAVFATAAAAIGLLANQPLASWVDRLRPYVAHPHAAHLLIGRAHDPSFPSDHATGGFALACGMLLYDRLVGAVLLVLAGALAFARVYVGIHYPGDVLAGAGIGVLAVLVIAIPPIRRALERFALGCSRVWDGVARLRPAPARLLRPNRR
jgi:undecaprenyl-diphosphatase